MGENIIDSGKREDDGQVIWLDTVTGDEWVDGTTCECDNPHDLRTVDTMCEACRNA